MFCWCLFFMMNVFLITRIKHFYITSRHCNKSERSPQMSLVTGCTHCPLLAVVTWTGSGAAGTPVLFLVARYCDRVLFLCWEMVLRELHSAGSGARGRGTWFVVQERELKHKYQNIDYGFTGDQLGPTSSALSLIPSLSLPDVLCDPTDLIWRKGTQFEAMTVS